MSKVSSLREMSLEQLTLELDGARKSLFTLRFQAASERNDAPSQAKRLRRRIAQILTIQRQRELAQS
ncbi:MAG: 50S ribosomal protein L29 [Planctomycetaceae bacterium]